MQLVQHPAKVGLAQSVLAFLDVFIEERALPALLRLKRCRAENAFGPDDGGHANSVADAPSPRSMQNPAGDSFTGTGATPTSSHSQSEMLRRTDSFDVHTGGNVPRFAITA